MGRRPTNPNAVPHLRRRLRAGKTWYYYDFGGKPRREQPLGCDYGLAIKKWAEIEREGVEKPRAVITFRYVADRYRAEVVLTKAKRTQKDNSAELTKLLAFFNDPPGPLEAIEPQHVRQYLRWRNTAPVRAAREKALLSHIWNWARNQGYTSLPNPCAGVRSEKSRGRDVYIEDTEFVAIWEHATQPLRDAMDLAYLTGQRPSDVLAFDESDIRDGELHIRQGKTDVKIRMCVSDELAAVLERIKIRKQNYSGCSTALVVNKHGRRVSLAILQRHWVDARKAAGFSAALQFRDLRAKAGTDKTDSSGDLRQAQQQLGHSSVVMTEHYVRTRRGSKVTPTR